MNLHDLHKAKQAGIIDLCPENEVEGEIIFYQQRLLDNAVVQKRRAGLCFAHIALILVLGDLNFVFVFLSWIIVSAFLCLNCYENGLFLFFYWFILMLA